MRGRFDRSLSILAVLLAVVFALVPVAVFAADDASNDNGDFLMKVGGSFTIDSNERVETLVVIDGNATVSGVVSESLIVIDGDAVVLDGGVVRGDLYVFSGSLDLATGSQVENVMLYDSDVTRAPDAVVTGTYDTNGDLDIGWSLGALSIVFWVGTTLFVLAAGLLFAAVARKQLIAAGNLLTHDAGALALATILMVVGLPVLAVVAVLTIIGIPVGIGLLLFVLPTLLFLGYLTAGIEFGSFIVRRVVPVEQTSHAYLAALVGLLLLQVVGLIPWFGFTILLLASTFGAGLLVLLAWRGWRGSRTPTTPTAAGQPMAA